MLWLSKCNGEHFLWLLSFLFFSFQIQLQCAKMRNWEKWTHRHHQEKEEEISWIKKNLNHNCNFNCTCVCVNDWIIVMYMYEFVFATMRFESDWRGMNLDRKWISLPEKRNPLPHAVWCLKHCDKDFSSTINTRHNFHPL